MLVRSCLAVAAHEVEDFGDDAVAEGVEHLVAFLAIDDDLAVAQRRQVLREVGLLDSQPFLDSSGGEFGIAKDLDDGDAGGVRKRLKDARLVCSELVQHRKD